MDNDTLITVLVSVVTSGVTAFAIVAFKMGRYSEKIDQIEKCDLNTRLSKLEGQYSVATITQRKSPISLNDTGLKLLNDSGSKGFVDDNLQELFAKIREQKPLTAYDVQEKSKMVVGAYREDQKFTPLKNFAFSQGIDLELVELAASLYLRDKALPEFGFTPADVDSTDPTKIHG